MPTVNITIEHSKAAFNIVLSVDRSMLFFIAIENSKLNKNITKNKTTCKGNRISIGNVVGISMVIPLSDE